MIQALLAQYVHSRELLILPVEALRQLVAIIMGTGVRSEWVASPIKPNATQALLKVNDQSYLVFSLDPQGQTRYGPWLLRRWAYLYSEGLAGTKPLWHLLSQFQYLPGGLAEDYLSASTTEVVSLAEQIQSLYAMISLVRRLGVNNQLLTTLPYRFSSEFITDYLGEPGSDHPVVLYCSNYYPAKAATELFARPRPAGLSLDTSNGVDLKLSSNLSYNDLRTLTTVTHPVGSITWDARLVALAQLEGSRWTNETAQPLTDVTGQSYRSWVSYEAGSKYQCRAASVMDSNSYELLCTLPGRPSPLLVKSLRQAATRVPHLQGSLGYGYPRSDLELQTQGCDLLPYLNTNPRRQLAWLLDSIDRLRFATRGWLPRSYRHGGRRLKSTQSTYWLMGYEAERTGLHPLLYLQLAYDQAYLYDSYSQLSPRELRALPLEIARDACLPEWLRTTSFGLAQQPNLAQELQQWKQLVSEAQGIPPLLATRSTFVLDSVPGYLDHREGRQLQQYYRSYLGGYSGLEQSHLLE